jgi:hypothetical protein
MANSPGGLELLPSKAYGNNWLEIRRGSTLLKSLPEYGDPYKEIYQLQGKWYGLLRPEWINPAGLADRSVAITCGLLEEAKNFHELIGATYHPCSYAHYSAESARPSWETVCWVLNEASRSFDWETLSIARDDAQGNFDLRKHDGKSIGTCRVGIGPSTGPGDQTVPLRSSEHQLLSGKFKGIFRQSGYEHQASYKDSVVLRATMFSLIRIIQTMQWSSCV